jgi:hypothetical protein
MINSLSIVTQNQPHDANVPESSKLSATIATALLYTVTVVTQAYAVPVTSDFPKLRFEDSKIVQIDFWIQPNQQVNWWKSPGFCST